MTTTYTFVNPLAARLFAEIWEKNFPASTRIPDNDAVVVCLGNALVQSEFRIAAEWFNAASQKAREIGEGDDATET